jgi:hypothetical protein
MNDSRFVSLWLCARDSSTLFFFVPQNRSPRETEIDFPLFINFGFLPAITFRRKTRLEAGAPCGAERKFAEEKKKIGGKLKISKQNTESQRAACGETSASCLELLRLPTLRGEQQLRCSWAPKSNLKM